MKKFASNVLSSSPSGIRDGCLGVVIITLVVGSSTIAVLDPASRPDFIDLTKVAVIGYLGSMVRRPPPVDK